MKKNKIILIGAGGHAKSCIDVIKNTNDYEIFGLIGETNQKGSMINNYKVIGTDQDLIKLSNYVKLAFISIGQIKSYKVKYDLHLRAKEIGFILPTIISPLAYVSDHAEIGEGTIIMHGAIINSGAKIGSNCIINTRSIVEHETIVEDHCHISTGVILNGNVKVKQKSFVGSGVVVKENISIGEQSIIRMGLEILQDVRDNSIVKRVDNE